MALREDQIWVKFETVQKDFCCSNFPTRSHLHCSSKRTCMYPEVIGRRKLWHVKWLNEWIKGKRHSNTYQRFPNSTSFEPKGPVVVRPSLLHYFDLHAGVQKDFWPCFLRREILLEGPDESGLAVPISIEGWTSGGTPEHSLSTLQFCQSSLWRKVRERYEQERLKAFSSIGWDAWVPPGGRSRQRMAPSSQIMIEWKQSLRLVRDRDSLEEKELSSRWSEPKELLLWENTFRGSEETCKRSKNQHQERKG